MVGEGLHWEVINKPRFVVIIEPSRKYDYKSYNLRISGKIRGKIVGTYIIGRLVANVYGFNTEKAAHNFAKRIMKRFSEKLNAVEVMRVDKRRGILTGRGRYMGKG